jgi:2-hydroxy-3-keto-5-methylthiopentenyl-1-phosphate phosphatase
MKTMTPTKTRYKAIISSDWNECLAPCGPFDFISFSYPALAPDLDKIFKSYTNNIIALREATGLIQSLLPGPITKEQMDAYLEESFVTYKGVPDLIEWCLSSDVLFMINTTGMTGYFQRVFAMGLLPTVPALSSNPMIRYPDQKSDPLYLHDLFGIQDKGKNTEVVVHAFGIPREKIILMGDSGGDGPHFKWGKRFDAYLIGIMTKASLKAYCENEEITLDASFGLSCAEGERDREREMKVDFMALSPLIEAFLLR